MPLTSIVPIANTTSDLIVADILAARPYNMGDKGGDFVAPDNSQRAEKIQTLNSYQHKLNLDQLRAKDGAAKLIRFGAGSAAALTVNEWAQKSTTDSRTVEQLAQLGLSADALADIAEMHRNDILDG